MPQDLEQYVRALKKRRGAVDRLIEDVETMIAHPNAEKAFQRPFLARIKKTINEIKSFRFVGSQ